MAAHDTNNFHLYVQQVDGTYVEVGSLTRWSRPRSRPRSRTALLGGGQISKTGAREETMSFAGVIDLADIGQNRLRAVEALDQPVRVAVVKYGSTGKSYLANVMTTGHTASADESSDQETSFDLDIITGSVADYPPPPAVPLTFGWRPHVDGVVPYLIPAGTSYYNEPVTFRYLYIDDGGKIRTARRVRSSPTEQVGGPSGWFQEIFGSPPYRNDGQTRQDATTKLHWTRFTVTISPPEYYRRLGATYDWEFRDTLPARVHSGDARFKFSRAGVKLIVCLSDTNSGVILAQVPGGMITTGGDQLVPQLEAVHPTYSNVSTNLSVCLSVMPWDSTNAALMQVNDYFEFYDFIPYYGEKKPKTSYEAFGIAKASSGLINAATSLPVHQKKGLFVGQACRNAIVDSGYDGRDVGQGALWGRTNWAPVTDTGEAGPQSDYVTGDTWKLWDIGVGGALQTNVPINFKTSDPALQDNLQGTRVWIHIVLKADPGHALPVSGALQLEAYPAAITGPIGVDVDEGLGVWTANGSVIFPAGNTSHTATIIIRNVSGAPIRCRVWAIMLEREGFIKLSAANGRDYGGYACCAPQLSFLASGVSPNGVDPAFPDQQMPEHRIDDAADVVSTEGGLYAVRTFIDAWDLQTLQDSFNALHVVDTNNSVGRKLMDSGTPASDDHDFHFNIGAPFGVLGTTVGLEVALHPGAALAGSGYRSSILHFTLPTNAIRRHAYNDICIVWSAGRITAVFINGIWYDNTSVYFAGENWTPGLAWDFIHAFYIGGDRDHAAAWNGFFTSVMLSKQVPSRAQVAMLFDDLDARGDCGIRSY